MQSFFGDRDFCISILCWVIPHNIHQFPGKILHQNFWWLSYCRIHWDFEHHDSTGSWLSRSYRNATLAQLRSWLSNAPPTSHAGVLRMVPLFWHMACWKIHQIPIRGYVPLNPYNMSHIPNICIYYVYIYIHIFHKIPIISAFLVGSPIIQCHVVRGFSHSNTISSLLVWWFPHESAFFCSRIFPWPTFPERPSVAGHPWTSDAIPNPEARNGQGRRLGWPSSVALLKGRMVQPCNRSPPKNLGFMDVHSMKCMKW